MNRSESPNTDGIEWKEFYNGYWINNNGEIWSAKSNKLRKTSIDKYGYEYLTITDKGTKKFMIHRLVAIYFIDNPLNKKCVNHIDGNKINNNYLNLEWCTISENNKHAFNIGLKKPCGGVKPKPILQITESGLILEYKSQREASRLTNIDQASIWRALNKKVNKAGNSIWMYKED